MPRLTSLVLTALISVACASGSATVAGTSSAPRDPAFAAALERAAGGTWTFLRIDAGCRADAGGWESATLYGSGVGVWNERRQLTLPRDRLRELVGRFRAIGFAALPDVIGGSRRVAPSEPPTVVIQQPGPPRRLPLQAVCVLSLQVDGSSKRVQQLDRGERSRELVALARSIVDLAAAAGRDGVTAASLQEGLVAVAAGGLAPEVLGLSVNHRGAGGDGWLLVVNGARASVRELGRGGTGGVAAPRVLDLEPAAAAGLARALAERRFATLPVNMYAEGYTEVRAELLGHEHSVLAQRFAGMSRSTHAERHADLEAIVAAVTGMARRVTEEGAVDAGGAEE